MPGFGHNAAFAVVLHGHGAFHRKDVFALVGRGDMEHVLVRALAFAGHDGWMKLKADHLEQHIRDARVRAVEQRHRTAGAALPLHPEHGGQLAGQRLRKDLVHRRVKHL